MGKTITRDVTCSVESFAAKIMLWLNRRASLSTYLLVIVIVGIAYFIISSTFVSKDRDLAVTHVNEKKHLRDLSGAFIVNCSQLCGHPNDKNVEKDYVLNSTSSSESVTTHSPLTFSLKLNISNRPSNIIQPYPLTWAAIDETKTTVFSAYYDERPELHGPSIVILGMQSRKHQSDTLYCTFKYANGTFACMEKSIVLEMDACNQQKESHKKHIYKFVHVFHICRLVGQEIPQKVAVSHNSKCNPSSSFITIYNHQPREKAHIGICIETPIFKKTKEDLVTFIEMQRLLGADIFTMYFLDVPEDAEYFLTNTYKNKVDIIHWHKLFRERDPIHYYGEVLAIQDCLFRNRHRVNYLMFVDLDEVIISRRHSDWPAMLAELDKEYIDSFIFINKFFLETPSKNIPPQELESWQSFLCNDMKIPDYFTHFEKTLCRYHFYERSKMILKPKYIIDTDIHGPCTHKSGYTHFFVPDDMAMSQHYRSKPTIECKKNRKKKRYETTHDDYIVKYAPDLLQAVHKKLCQ